MQTAEFQRQKRRFTRWRCRFDCQFGQSWRQELVSSSLTNTNANSRQREPYPELPIGYRTQFIQTHVKPPGVRISRNGYGNLGGVTCRHGSDHCCLVLNSVVLARAYRTTKCRSGPVCNLKDGQTRCRSLRVAHERNRHRRRRRKGPKNNECADYQPTCLLPDTSARSNTEGVP